MYMKPENIFAQIAEAGEEEQFDLLFKSPNCRIDRIVSSGHSSPKGFWYDQENDEFILLIQGEATLEFEDRKVTLKKAQRISFQHRHQILTALFSAPLDVLPMTVLLCVKLADRHLLPDGVNAIVKVPLDFLHLFPEREVIPLSGRGLVGGDQPPGVHELRFPVCVRIFVSVSSVFSLALSSP